MTRRGPSRAANIWTARIIPVILLGIIGYCSWVVTEKVCIEYLLHPDPPTQPRSGTAIAILVIYYLLLIPLLICYGRLIQNIVTNPGYVPRSPAWLARNAESNTKSKHHSLRAHEKDATSRSSAESLSTIPSRTIHTDDHGNPPASEFWLKDHFIAKFDGRPPFCSTCLNWKPDRTHHCSEVNRCVHKMDHFCPWVGGIVSETSFKFFIQFLFYTACFCTHTLIFSAYFLAERSRKGYELNVHWILLVAFAALFWLFSAGMFSSSMQFAALNVTTIENFERRRKVWYVCVYLPRPEEVLGRLERQGRMVPRTIPYPRPAEENAVVLQDALGQEAGASGTRGIDDLPPTQATRSFAILELPAGANPWDCGPLANVKEVLGHSFLDWFLPLKRSPCAIHNDPDSMFKLGPAVAKAKQEAGLIDGPEHAGPSEGVGEQRKKRRRRKSEGPVDAESSTDGERRARRHRHRHRHRERRASSARGAR